VFQFIFEGGGEESFKREKLEKSKHVTLRLRVFD